MNFDFNLFELIEAIVIVVALVVLIFETRRTGRLLKSEAHERLSQSYSDGLLQGMEDQALDAVWEPIPEERLEKLRQAQNQKLYGAWYAMTKDERRCYRWTRSLFNTFEQAHYAHENELVSDNAWPKWKSAIDAWLTTSFVEFVLEDNKSRFLPAFRDYLECNKKKNRPAAKSYQE